jgi:hypothetical protein
VKRWPSGVYVASLAIDAHGGMNEYGPTPEAARAKLVHTIRSTAASVADRLERGKDVHRKAAWAALRCGELPLPLKKRLAAALALPWKGRKPSQCKFKPGDLVQFIPSFASSPGWGVILARPPSPKMIEGWGRARKWTRDDDVYVLGLPRRHRRLKVDHDRVAEVSLSPVDERALAPEMAKALHARYERWVAFPVLMGPEVFIINGRRVVWTPVGRLRIWKFPKSVGDRSSRKGGGR